MAVRRSEAARWRRALEWLLFALPVAAGACVVVLGAAVRRVDDPSLGGVAVALVERPALAVVLLVVLTLVGLAWTVGLAATIYLDAAAVESAGAEEWDTRGSVYAALALVLPLATLHYLRRRHRHVEPTIGSGWWWLGLPVAVLVLVVPIVAVRQGMAPPAVVLAGQGLALAVLPVAAYRDATRVRAVGASWRPDPASHFLLAVLAALLALPVPFYAGYYLLRRGTAT